MKLDTSALFNIGAKNKDDQKPQDVAYRWNLTVIEQEEQIKNATERLLTPDMDDRTILNSCLSLIKLYNGNTAIYDQVRKNIRERDEKAAEKIRAILSEIMEDVEEDQDKDLIIAKFAYVIKKYMNIPRYDTVAELVRAMDKRRDYRDKLLGIKPYYYVYREIAELKRTMDYSETEKRHMKKLIGEDKIDTLEAILKDIVDAEKE